MKWATCSGSFPDGGLKKNYLMWKSEWEYLKSHAGFTGKVCFYIKNKTRFFLSIFKKKTISK